MRVVLSILASTVCLLIIVGIASAGNSVNARDDHARRHWWTATPTATTKPISTPTGTPKATSTPVPSATPSPKGTSTPTATSIPNATASPTNTAVPSPIVPGTSPTPVAGQPCPQWVHDQYVAKGPDGQMYATWHPPIDPVYKCTFGHDHGDDPNGSPALRGHPVIFGYATKRAGLTDPHEGFKVYRWDNIQPNNPPSSSQGAYLVETIHQGTSGAARFTTVTHEVTFHYYNPNDGRELHLTMEGPFGKLMAGCGANDPSPALVQQQANIPGLRQVPSDKCFNAPNIPYEDWLTALYVGGQSNWKAYVDPHFAVFNPNTYCVVQNGACTAGYSDVRAGTGADPTGTNSSYKGTHREAYLNQVWIKNAGGPTTIWTDPAGNQVDPSAANAIPQYISAVNVTPQDNSQVFDSNKNFDQGGTVHAPN